MFRATKDVFHNLAMKVLVSPQPIKGSAVDNFIQDLHAMPNLHFVEQLGLG